MVLLPEHGRLEETPFPVLLLDLHRAQFSGWVRLTRERSTKSFLFRGGVPMFAESNLTSESLGVQLMDAGKISRGDYSRVVEKVERSGCKEGQALLELELIAPRGLFVALKDQVRGRLLECFGWSRGDFKIEPGEPPPEETQPFRTDIYSLIQAGIASHWASERILADFRDRMGQIARRTALVPRIEPHLSSDAATQAFIDALDGSRTFWQALQRATSPKALAAAWLLDQLRAIEYAAPEESRSQAEGSGRMELDIYFSDLVEESSRAEERLRRTTAAAGPARTRAGRERTEVEVDAAAVLQRTIADKFDRLDELDHYQLLGVDEQADARALKLSYLRAAKDFHPDALARQQIHGEVREQANKIFAAIGRAYAVLNRPKSRREYDASLHGDVQGIDAEQVAMAETLFRKGEILLRQGNFRGALEFLRPAVEIYPDEADYRNALGWALYKKLPSDPTAAREHLEAALAMSADDATIHFRLSLVLRSLGDEAGASQYHEKARRLNPKIR
jgi:curved DNA-binding protein CbpA